MKAFEVIGGKKLIGEITPQGAKNEALQVICAVLLTEEPVRISNIPSILDVKLLIEILKELGVTVQKESEDTFLFNAKNILIDKIEDPEFHKIANKLRGSVMIAGPLLARFNR